MPKFNKSVQIRDLDDNNKVIDLDEGNADRRVVIKKQTKGKFLGLHKCRKRLAIKWLTHCLPGESSGSEEDNDHVNDGAEGLGEDNVEFNDGAEGLRQDNVEFKDGVEGLGHDNMFEDYDQEHGNEKEVSDYDSFESDVGDDDINSDRRKVLRERKGEELKDKIRAHAVETRRHITIMKNDNVKVKAKCLSIIPTLGDADVGSFGLSKSNGITINEEVSSWCSKHKAFRAKSEATEVMKGDAESALNVGAQTAATTQSQPMSQPTGSQPQTKKKMTKNATNRIVTPTK
ncbi:hypothetical protein Tco_0877146 [Tanacetum coccineum]|uniref:Uncharacterized protein n=1 Tax=Tanacetum coccineum TaxID=301880 RepID=A0ABQ5BUB0_9ASTR